MINITRQINLIPRHLIFLKTIVTSFENSMLTLKGSSKVLITRDGYSGKLTVDSVVLVKIFN